MNKYILTALPPCLLLMTVVAFGSDPVPRIPENIQIYSEHRDWGQTCPPRFDSTEEMIEQFLRGEFSGQMVPIEQFIEAFELPELSKRDFVLLEDTFHSDVCAKLNETYARQWEKVVDLHPDVEPMFIYDITYYSLHDFYIVVRAGGLFLLPPPDGESRPLLYHHMQLGRNMHLYSEHLEMLPRYQVEDMLQLFPEANR